MTDTPDARPTFDMLMQLADDYAAWAWNLGVRERATSAILHLKSRAALEAYARRLAAPVQPQKHEANSIHLGLPSGHDESAQPPEPTTPAATWRERGEPDPHGKLYDGERAKLCMGNLSDDELANAVFMFGDRQPPIKDLIAGKAFTPIVYLTAAKERIRWLSRRLVEAEAKLAATAQQGGER